MFDHYTIRPQIGPTRVETHEHRAPTDESIKLLVEFEEKARARVIDAYVTKSNDLHGAVIRERCPERDEIVFIYRFDLNGKRYVIEEAISSTASFVWNEHEARKHLVKVVAEAIAKVLL